MRLIPRPNAIVLAAMMFLVPPAAPTGTARAAEEPAAKPATAGGSLAGREQELAQQFRDLEKTFLRLADLLAPSDPRRATLLRNVFEQARTGEVSGRLDTIVQLLEKGQLLKAGASQADTLDRLRELLAVLESGETDKRLASEKEEVRQFLGRLSKLIARQRDVEGSTEAGAREAKLAERQSALAEEAGGLAGDIGRFAKRMEPKNETGKDQAGKDEAGKDEAGKDQAGRDETGKDPRAADAAEQGGKPGTEKSDGGKGPDGKAEDAQADKGADGAAGGKADDGAGDKKPGGGAEQEGSAGDGAAGEDSEKPDGDDDAARARRTRKRVAAAEQRMRQAQEKLEQAKRRDARQEQERAIEELETARAELEEILRQMREQEVERLLVQLETRLRTMLRAQRAVLAGAEKLAAEERPPTDRERQLEAVRLSREQQGIGSDATKALTLVRDDGSAVAIPEALEQVRDDAGQAALRLSRGDVGGTTRGILQDLVTSLEEMIAALEKAKREQQARQQGSQQGRPAEPGEQPLVDKLAELKMIRSLQMRVNSRTKRFSKLLAEGAEQAEEPELLDALERLAERQRKIERAAHDIVTGRTE